MMTRMVTRRQAMIACALMLGVGVLAPQMVAACGGGPPPELSNVVVSPGEKAALISFDTEIARGSTLVLWSDDVQQSRRSLDDSFDLTQHAFKVAALQPNTRYHYEIRLLDPAGVSYVAYAADLRTRPFSGQDATDGTDSGDAVTDQG